MSRVIFDARDLSAPTVEVIEPNLTFEDLENAALVRKYMQELRQMSEVIEKAIQSHESLRMEFLRLSMKWRDDALEVESTAAEITLSECADDIQSILDKEAE